MEENQGCIIESEVLLNQGSIELNRLTAAEDFQGKLIISEPSDSTFSLRKFPFLGVVFEIKDQSGGITSIRRNSFFYILGLLLLLTLFGLFLTYRTVRKEAAVNRLKANFVSAVSHEFRSPLAAIQALLERFETGKVRDPLMADRYHLTIRKEVHRLSQMVDELLNFSRLEDGRQRMMVRSLELNSVVGETVESFERLGYKHRLMKDFVDTDLLIDGDKTLISQCVQNLVDNALKYSSEESTVTIETECDETHAFCKVSDRGIGIHLSEQKAIFHQFVRSEIKDHPNIKGVGLGLALVKRIMEEHHGEVIVESKPQKGSHFTLKFPLLDTNDSGKVK
jgi:signal transduction histidine kinase